MNAHRRIVGLDDPSFDPVRAFAEKNGSEVIENPYPQFAQMRHRAPVIGGDFRTPFGLPADPTLADMQHFTVLGYAEVQQVLGDQIRYGNSIYDRNLGVGFGRSITTMDPPEHPRFRRLFQKAFTPAALANWGENVVAPVVDDFLSNIEGRGHAELVGEFTSRYPFRFIYGQLALPPEHVDTFHKLTVALTCTNYPKMAVEASRKLGEYFLLLLQERRDTPGDDLISTLATAEIDGERLPNEVIVSFLRQLMNAGGDTTYRGTSNTLAGLLGNAEQFAAVKQDRSLIPRAIEEGLRWEAPVVSLQRVANVDVELAGVRIPKGAALDVVIGAANRDESHYADPDVFDISRLRQRHTTFGFGPHICIGQHLARLEMTVALNALLDRLPSLRLDPDLPPPAVHGLALRAAAAIHVIFG